MLNASRTVACLWLTAMSAHLLCVPAATATKALCIGADGHVEIEFADHGTCASSPAAKPIDHASLAAVMSADGPGANHCGHCVDIPLNGHHDPFDADKLIHGGRDDFFAGLPMIAHATQWLQIPAPAKARNSCLDAPRPVVDGPLYLTTASLLI